MARRLGFIFFALSLLAGYSRAQMSPVAARLAVIGDSGSADFAALVVTDLANEPSINLLERQDMMKIGDELHLQQLAGDSASNLGRMLNADGLLFIKKQPTGFEIRLTAVGLGYAVFDDTVSSATPSDFTHLAQSIARRTVDFAPKLSLKPDAAVPLSVLNIRADAASGDYVSLEEKLSLLLESKLAAQPGDVVLERRRASAILFEKSLVPSAGQAPLKGAYVVDGSFTQSLQGGNDLAVHLRLRSPTAQQNPLEIQGSSSDLGALADQMVAAIQKAIGKPGPPTIWQPAKEAREYLLEGIWGWKHGAFDEALEALDSASLLGEKLPDLEAARIHVLCAKAVGSTGITGGYPDTPDDPHPEARIEAILRAIDEEQSFESNGAHQPLQILTVQDLYGTITEYRQTVGKAAVSLLEMLDRTQNPEADSIRTKVDAYMHFDPLHRQLPENIITAIPQMDELARSPEEETAYVKSIIDSPNIMWLMTFRGQMNSERFCARFVPDLNVRRAKFLQLMQGLKQDDAARPTAFLILANEGDTQDPKTDEAFQQYVDELWNEREKLLANGRLSYFLGEGFDLEASAQVPTQDPTESPELITYSQLMAASNTRLLDLLHFLLQRSNGIDGRIAQAWKPGLFSATDAPTFWSEFQTLAAKPTMSGSNYYAMDMRRRYVNRWGPPPDHYVVPPGAPVIHNPGFSPITSAPTPGAPFVNNPGYPQANPVSAVAPLVVNRFWYPKDASDAGPFELEHLPLACDAKGVWVSVSTGGDDQPIKPEIYHVDIDATQQDPFTTEPPLEPPISGTI
jgi:hypothetical protein